MEQTIDQAVWTPAKKILFRFFFAFFLLYIFFNPNGVFPEVGASCDAVPGSFDPDNPPPFDPTPPGKDAKPMDYKGSANAQPEAGGMNQPVPSGAPSSGPAGSTAPSAPATK